MKLCWAFSLTVLCLWKFAHDNIEQKNNTYCWIINKYWILRSFLNYWQINLLRKTFVIVFWATSTIACFCFCRKCAEFFIIKCFCIYCKRLLSKEQLRCFCGWITVQLCHIFIQIFDVRLSWYCITFLWYIFEND